MDWKRVRDLTIEHHTLGGGYSIALFTQRQDSILELLTDCFYATGGDFPVCVKEAKVNPDAPRERVKDEIWKRVLGTGSWVKIIDEAFLVFRDKKLAAIACVQYEFSKALKGKSVFEAAKEEIEEDFWSCPEFMKDYPEFCLENAANIHTLAVSPKFQRNKLGELLLWQLLTRIRELRKIPVAHTSASLNAAVALHRKMGAKFAPAQKSDLLRVWYPPKKR